MRILEKKNSATNFFKKSRLEFLAAPSLSSHPSLASQAWKPHSNRLSNVLFSKLFAFLIKSLDLRWATQILFIAAIVVLIGLNLKNITTIIWCGDFNALIFSKGKNEWSEEGG